MRSREFIQPAHEIVVIVHNIRSVLNVGSIFRTCEGFGVSRIFLSGTTLNAENQLPHVRDKMAKELHKTALGAEEIVPHEFAPDIFELIKKLKKDGFQIVGLEQDERAISLPELHSASFAGLTGESKKSGMDSPTKSANDDVRDFAKIALLLGEEVNGIALELREMCDDLVEIPMFGRKESFNVSVAAGIILYELLRQ